MQLFKAYLRQRRRIIGLFFLCGLAFMVSLVLYHLPMQAIFYPGLLCLLFGGLALVLDFWRERQNHERLSCLQGLSELMEDALPPAETIQDADYQALIRALGEQITALNTAADARYRDMMDYYTVWVHQIKTPIASMHLTLQKEDTPLARTVASDLFRIEQYVDMVLAYLRLDAETTDYVFRSHSIDAIVRRAVKQFAPEFINRHLKLTYEPLNGTVITDEKWLEFVLEQLLSNALKYTRKGGIRIYMEAPQTLCIADTGIGIAPEDLPRIFEKGYTGGNGRLDQKASGLGLYLCKQICDGLSIGLSASSVPGEGTVLRLELEQYQLRAE